SLREGKLGANDPKVLDLCAEYAELLTKLKRSDEASKFRERITMANSLAAALPPPGQSKSTAPGTDVFSKFVEKARADDAQQNRDQALADWKLAVAEAEKRSKSDGRLSFALVHLGDEYMYKKQPDEAEALFKRALELREQAGATATLGMARNMER